MTQQPWGQPPQQGWGQPAPQQPQAPWGQPPAQQPQYGPPQQPWGQPPAQQAPSAPAKYEGGADDDPFGGEKIPAVSWKNAPIGAMITMEVTSEPDVVQSRDFDTNALEWWPAENGQAPQPKWSVVVNGVVNGEKRSLWGAKTSKEGSLCRAIGDAQRAAGFKVAPGTRLTVRLVGEEPPPPGSRNSPRKLYQAKLDPGAPGGAGDAFAQPQQPGTVAQQQPGWGRQPGTVAQQQPQQGPPPGWDPAGQVGYAPPAQQGPPPGWGQQPQQQAPNPDAALQAANAYIGTPGTPQDAAAAALQQYQQAPAAQPPADPWGQPGSPLPDQPPY